MDPSFSLMSKMVVYKNLNLENTSKIKKSNKKIIRNFFFLRKKNYFPNKYSYSHSNIKFFLVKVISNFIMKVILNFMMKVILNFIN